MSSRELGSVLYGKQSSRGDCTYMVRGERPAEDLVVLYTHNEGYCCPGGQGRDGVEVGDRGQLPKERSAMLEVRFGLQLKAALHSGWRAWRFCGTSDLDLNLRRVARVQSSDDNDKTRVYGWRKGLEDRGRIQDSERCLGLTLLVPCNEENLKSRTHCHERSSQRTYRPWSTMRILYSIRSTMERELTNLSLGVYRLSDRDACFQCCPIHRLFRSIRRLRYPPPDDTPLRPSLRRLYQRCWRVLPACRPPLADQVRVWCLMGISDR